MRAARLRGRLVRVRTGDDLDTLRFDPEGVRVGADGTFFVSDEYGPYIFQFDRQGHLQRRIRRARRSSRSRTPTGDVDSAGNSLELYPAYNMSGRQANRGMEGLAITPDGRTLVGIMQNALIQDNGLNDSDAARAAWASTTGSTPSTW